MSVVWVTTPSGEELPMSNSDIDDLYAEVLRLRAEVELYKPKESIEVGSTL